MLREEGVSFQAIKTFKVSNDPDFEGQEEPGTRAVMTLRMARRNGVAVTHTSWSVWTSSGR
jgi:hypothetical protein